MWFTSGSVYGQRIDNSWCYGMSTTLYRPYYAPLDYQNKSLAIFRITCMTFLLSYLLLIVLHYLPSDFCLFHFSISEKWRHGARQPRYGFSFVRNELILFHVCLRAVIEEKAVRRMFSIDENSCPTRDSNSHLLRSAGGAMRSIATHEVEGAGSSPARGKSFDRN